MISPQYVDGLELRIKELEGKLEAAEKGWNKTDDAWAAEVKELEGRLEKASLALGEMSEALIKSDSRLDAVLDVIRGYRLALNGQPAEPHFMDQANMLSAIAAVVES